MDNMYLTIGENMRYFMYKYKFSTNDWYRPLSFLINKIQSYVNSTVNLDIVCTASAINELCQARDMGSGVVVTSENPLSLLSMCNSVTSYSRSYFLKNYTLCPMFDHGFMFLL